MGIDDTTFARTRGKLQKDVKGILWEKEMKAKYIVVEESYKKNPPQMLDRR